MIAVARLIAVAEQWAGHALPLRCAGLLKHADRYGTEASRRVATAFFFDSNGGLVQTVVLFPSVDFAQAAGTLHGIHGQPVEDRPGAAAARVWRDEKRHSIVAAAADSGTILTYKSSAPR